MVENCRETNATRYSDHTVHLVPDPVLAPCDNSSKLMSAPKFNSKLKDVDAGVWAAVGCVYEKKGRGL